MVHVSSYVRKYESHIGKTLKDHTIGTSIRALDLFDTICTRTSTLLHDTGKLNPNFDLHLHGKNTHGLYTNHSFLSLYTFLNLLNEYGDNDLILSKILGPDKNFWNENILIIMICILKHHGGLPNLDPTDKYCVSKEEFQRLKNFLNTNPNLPLDEFISYIDLSGLVSFPVKDIPFNEISNFFKLNEIKSDVHDNLDFFLNLRMCFSSLVSADKGDAGDYDISKANSLSSKLISKYPNRLNGYLKTLDQSSTLNKVRTHIRTECLSNLENAMNRCPDQRVFCLTEPTGSGKTLILMDLAKTIIARTNIKKIIYSIPFLSITEQVYSIIEDIFSEKGDEEYIKRLDCKADTDIDFSFLKEIDIEETFVRKLKSLFLKLFKGKTLREEAIQEILLLDYNESTFHYPLIVTTFVQMFQSFTTSSNRGLMRFSSLPGSIFLIDEIQALPPRLYTFFVAMLDAFCKKFNCYAIVSTATMPNFSIPENSSARKLFKNYSIPIELGNPEDFQNSIFNRYEINTIRENSGTTSSLDFICDKISSETMPTVAIFNTVKDSKIVYKKLKEKVNCPVFLLNSNIFSAHRRYILKQCKELLDGNGNSKLKWGERFFLITTQLIEAGVDIDFPVLYRDIAPLPSLIQSAGRCNRNSMIGYVGKVYVFCLNSMHTEKPHLGLRASTIYNGKDAPFLQYSINNFFLITQTVFSENTLYNIQAAYFNNLSTQLEIGSWKDSVNGVTENKNFIEQINNYQFHDIGKFTVIDKEAYGDQVSFYVPVDDKDTSYEDLIKIWSDLKSFEDDKVIKPKEDGLKELLSKRVAMHKLFRKMMDRVIQVHLKNYTWDKNVVSLYSEYGDSSILDMYKLKLNFYSPEYGFRKENEDV